MSPSTYQGQELSHSPSSGAVARSVGAHDADVIKLDIERNLKLWSCQEALQNGRLPSNGQLDAALVFASKRCVAHETSTLSDDTLGAIKAARRLLETFRLVLKAKNADELIQDTVWLTCLESSRGYRKHAGEAVEEAAQTHNIDKDLEMLVEGTAQEYGVREGELAQAARHVRRLAMMLFTNPEVRAALVDLVKIGREMVTGKPAAEDVEDVDDDADVESVVFDENGQPIETIGENGEANPAETPDLHIPGEFLSDWDNDSSDGEDDSDEIRWEDAQAHPEQASKQAKREARIQELVASAVKSLQDKDGYGDSMAWLLDTFEAYESEMFALAHGEPEVEPGASRLGPATHRIMSNIVTLAERFAHGKSVAPVQQSILAVYTDILSSPDLKLLGREVDALIRRVMVEQGYVESQDCVTASNDLWERGRGLFSNELYRAHWSTLCTGVSSWLGWGQELAIGSEQVASNFNEDPLTRKLDRDWQRFIKALILDKRRRPEFKRRLWSDLAGMIVPALGGLGFIPIPRIEMNNPFVELVLENVYLSVENLVPTVVKFDQQDSYNWSPFSALRATSEAGNEYRLRMDASQVQVDVKDVPFSLRCKKGIPFTDTGMLDISLSRQGLSITLDVDIDTRDDHPQVLRVRDVKVSIDELDFSFHKTKRDWLYRLVFTSVAVPLLKQVMKVKMEAKIKQRLAQLDVHLVDIRNRYHVQSKKAAAKQKEGEAAPGVTGTLIRILGDKIKELDEAKRLRRPLLAGKAGARAAIRKADEAAGLSEKQLQPPPDTDSEAEDEPGGPRKRKKFKISDRLENTLLPMTTPNAEASWVYRRWRVEEAARRSALASDPGRSLPPTTMGLGVGSPRPWRSPVFTFG